MEPTRESAADQPEPIIIVLPNGSLQANCYLMLCPNTREAIVVDPGAEPERLLAAIASAGARVKKVVHTHGHFDHIGATEAVLAGLPERVPVAGHLADAYLYDRAARVQGVALGYPLPQMLVAPDETLTDGAQLRVGDLCIEVIATPGHTPGSVSLRAGGVLLSGDTLFHRGIGRTDLPGGDEDQIYTSILTRLYPLPEALRVLPGHGPETTIGAERRLNPFVQALEQ
ncbi:MAG: MBL fold metallo-hydrolase [Ktedonobacterales bacterium]